MAIFRRLLLLAVCFITGIAILNPAQTAHAADFAVGCNADAATRVNDLITAIESANSAATDDTITLTADCVYSLTAANNTVGSNGNNGLPAIENNGTLTINGNGATIERSSAGGTPSLRLLYIQSGAVVTLDSMTLQGANNNAIFNGGNLTLSNSAVTGNSGGGGGGIFNDTPGSLHVINSTISGNFTSPSSLVGGGFYNRGTATLTNSTVANNTANIGGGFYQNSGTITLNNSIIANNTGTTSDPECFSFNGTITGSNNVIETACGGNATNNTTNTLSGDPLLGALADNGGASFTHRLQGGSIAIDAGSNTIANNAGLTTDQRGTGFNRIIGPTVDVGAFESICTGSDYTVADGDTTRLIEAITCANEDPANNSITLATGGIYTLTAANNTTGGQGSNGLPGIANNGTLTINGNGATIARSSAGGTANFRLLYVAAGADFTLRDVTLTNGNSSGFGGAMLSDGTVTLVNSTVYGNTGSYGGGLSVKDTARIINSTISNNTGTSGIGGIYFNDVMATVTNSTVADNTSTPLFGGIALRDANVTLNNTLVADNNSNNAPDCYAESSSTLSGSNSLYETTCVFSGSTDSRTNSFSGDPGLGDLADNGGLTQTHALSTGSSALDAGSNALAVDASNAALTTDQRGTGFGRVAGGTVDIGAVEAACTTTPFTVGDSDETGLIRAMNCANEDGVNSVINLTDSTYTLTTVNNTSGLYGDQGLPQILNNGTLTINGNGATIERSSAGGTPDFRLIMITNGANLTLNEITIQGGRSSISGAGIVNIKGTLNLNNSTISGNSASGGGGLYNDSASTIHVTNSTISGNSTFPVGSGLAGGGFYNFGTMTLVNSTIANNTADSAGGFNSQGGSITLRNTLVANNTAANFADCRVASGTITGSYNLIETACGGAGTNTLTNTIPGDPSIGSLADNGGASFTHRLLGGSSAIDAGDNSLASGLTTDQRGAGFNRVIGTTVDVGAFESICTGSEYTVADGDTTGLIDAITCANEDPANNTITLATDSMYTLTAANNSTGGQGDNGLPAIANNGTLTINGNGATIERSSAGGTPQFRLIFIQSGANLTLESVTVSNGNTVNNGGGFVNFGTVTLNNSTVSGNFTNSNGGGFYNNNGTATLNNSTVSGNSTDGIGGGFYNDGGTVMLVNSTVSDNSANFVAGGFFGGSGTVTVSNSTLSGNSANFGGGFATAGTVTVSNSTVSGNSATSSGGGFYNDGGTVTVSNSTVSGNSATNGGGFRSVSGTVNLNNSIVAYSTGVDCLNGGTLNGTNNLIEDGTCASVATLTGDPLLGALADNGGPTLTHALGDFSPAIDAGNNALAVDVNSNPLTTDQTGQPRFANDVNVIDTGTGKAPLVDLGAVERQTSSPNPTLSISDATRNEGNGGITYFTFIVTLSAPTEQMVTVNYASADGTATLADNDYVERTGTLLLTPGITQRQVSVVVNRDTAFEANETFTLNLNTPVNATLADGEGLGTITNDDSQPTMRISDLTQIEGNSGTSNFTFTVTLSHVSYQTITAQYATANGTALTGSDYTSASGTVTFNPGVTSQQIMVSVNGDLTYESHESFTVNLSNPVNTTLADGQGAGLIANDDNRPVIRINDVSRAEGNSGTSNFAFIITLSNPSYETITLNFATADGTATLANNDYITRTGLLSFAPGVTSRQITVQGNGDTVVESNEIFNLYLSGATNATFADNRGIGTITNDDVAGFAASLTLSAFGVSVNEGESTSYTVALAAAPADLLGSDSLTVELSFDPAYLSVTPASLTFDATNWNIPQTVTVLAVDDTQAAQASISLPVLHTLTSGEVSLNGAPFGVTITDNDALLVPVAPELPQIEAVAPVSPDAPSAELPGVVLVSPVRETSENPVAFTWVGTADATEYRVLVQNQADRAVVIDQTISAATCNGNICVVVSQFAPQAGVGYVWTVTPITANGAGQPSAEAGFSYSPSAPDGIELPGTVIGG